MGGSYKGLEGVIGSYRPIVDPAKVSEEAFEKSIVLSLPERSDNSF